MQPQGQAQIICNMVSGGLSARIYCRCRDVSPVSSAAVLAPQTHPRPPPPPSQVDFGMNVVEAGEAARYEHEGSTQPTGQVMTDGGVITVEAGVCGAAVADLAARGHNVTYGANQGGYQAIERVPVPGGGFYYAGASEFRKDGVVMSY